MFRQSHFNLLKSGIAKHDMPYYLINKYKNIHNLFTFLSQTISYKYIAKEI